MEPEQFVELKRQVFRSSEKSNAGKVARWALEKHLEPFLQPRRITRNSVMSPDIHSLWPVDRTRQDVLQEYFVPVDKFSGFVTALRSEIQKEPVNLLNVTIRDVQQDSDTVLNYANRDMFAFVLFLSQEATPAGERRMKEFTTALVDDVLELKGTFYLPYRPHYTRQQFLAAYPGAERFFATKQRFDPDERFSSAFYEHIRPSVDADVKRGYESLAKPIS
jgi:FAD/FMN-containing dehydrogenase